MKTMATSFHISQVVRSLLIVALCLSTICITGQGVMVMTQNVSCHGRSDGQAMVSGGQGTQPYTYQWSHNSAFSASRVIDLPKGSHHVTITDANGCTAVLDFEIEEPEPLQLTLHTIDYHHDFCDNTFCVTVEAIASGGTAPYYYESRVQTKCSPGAMIFLVIDKNGCVKTAKISFAEARSTCRASFDPNDIVGPSGYDDLQWVSSHDRMHYMVRYENDGELATGPAQYVEVRHDLDALVGPLSLRIGDFGFGPYIFEVPDNTSFYQKRLDLQDDLGIYLDVVAGLDAVSNQAFWQFETIDPATGLRPTDLTVGFLPPNDTLVDDGQGFVTFSVLPKSSVVTRDTIAGEAEIIFDLNAPIYTNLWQNTIDAAPPVTSLDPVPDTVTSQLVSLSWQGADDPLGSGISKYHLYSSRNGSPFILSQADITAQAFSFEGLADSHYDFYIVGVDNTGNTEMKTVSEQSTYILPYKHLELTSPLSQPMCAGDSLAINWNAILVDTVDVLLSLDSGMTFQPIIAGALSSQVPYYWPISDTINLAYAQVMLQAPSDSLQYTGPVFAIRHMPNVSAGMDTGICIDGITNLSASGANVYTWSPLYNISQPNSFTTPAYPDVTTTYYVTGTDVFGCQNTDSVIISVYPISLDSVVTEMCDGDSILVGGAYQTTGGFYTDELISTQGCDSTVVTEIIITGPCPFPSPVVYVDKDAMGLNNGSSWMDAFIDLQDGIAAVNHYFNVHEIWIAEGAYATDGGTDRDTSFVLRDSIEIYGGFTGIETLREERLADPNLVLLSGDIGVIADSTDNAFHVLKADSTCIACVLDGLTIQYGQADLNLNEEYVGAGLLNKGVLFLNACILERNTSLSEGAAIYNTGNFADLLIKDCIFRLNTSNLQQDILNIDNASIRFQGFNQVQD